MAPGMGVYYVPPEELPLYETDVEQAKALLAKAGYPDGFDLTMYAATTYGPHPEIAQVLQQQWKEIGVNLNIEVIEWGVLLDHWGKGTFETITMRYAGYSDPHFDTYDRFHSSSPGNASKMADPVFDEMAQAASEISDPAERAAKYAEIQKYVVEQVPMIFISTAVVGYAMKPDVMGFRGWPNSWVSGYTDTWLDR
jgi:peptide/nickel transport system substrate-binding protein